MGVCWQVILDTMAGRLGISFGCSVPGWYLDSGFSWNHRLSLGKQLRLRSLLSFSYDWVLQGEMNHQVLENNKSYHSLVK